MPLKVIYIDDEIDLCEMFEDLFSSDQIHIQTYTNPTEGISAIATEEPDLVFLDYRMPNTTGDQLAAKLDAKLPRALITGDTSLSLEQKFDQIFEKPYDVERIEAYIKSFL